MPSFDAVTGYVWRGDTYCPDCVVKSIGNKRRFRVDHRSAEEILEENAARMNIDRNDEWSFDSWNFPKVVFATDADFWPDSCTKCGKSV